MSNRTILLCLLMLGLGSAAGAAAMRFGVLPRLLEHCHENAAQACPPASPAQPAAPTPPEPAAAQPPAPTVTPPSAAATATTLHRFLLCELGAGNPMLQPVDTRSQPQLWAVHCGTRVLLLGLDGSGADARPTRVATLTTRVPDPKLQLETAAILATDFAGSTRRDLLAAFSFRDAEGAPRGGSLFWLARNPSGGFSPPERLASAAARSLVRTRAGDLLIAHLEDPNLSHPSRLIAMHGGPSPVRAAALPLGVGVQAIAAVDIDLDGNDDVIALAQRPAIELVRLDAALAVRDRTPFELQAPREVITADIDADGHADAVIAGATVVALRSSAEGARELFPVLPAELHHLSAFDVDGDGHVDLVGFAGGALDAWLQKPGPTFERQALCPAEALPPGLAALTLTGLAHLEGKPRASLLGLRTLPGSPQHVELDVFECGAGIEPALNAPTETLPDAPLPLTFDAN